MDTKNIDLRAYFAAHAPAEPAKWFTPTLPEERPKPPEGARWCEGCKEDGDCETPEICAVMNKHAKAVKDWHARNQRSAAAQWRWAWADAVIEHRGDDKRTIPYDTAMALSVLAEIVEKSHLRGGWQSQPDGTLKPMVKLEDCAVHPDLIEKARQALARVKKGADRD